VSRRWDALTYDRVTDPLVRMGTSVLDRVRLAGDETVLDAGCGTGRVTEQLLERLPKGRVIALDMSAAMLDAASARLARFGDRVTFVQADLAQPVRLPDGQVDLVVSTAVFHWVTDQGALYRNLGSLIRVGGRLAAQCGGAGNCASVLATMESLGERPMDRLRFLAPDDARARLADAGFVDIEAWLQPEPVTFDTRAELETYLATVFLGPLTDRPATELPSLAAEVASRLRDLTIDYVRLNLAAVMALGPRLHTG
jgi:trans-aconitate 2-methyltransferase